MKGRTLGIAVAVILAASICAKKLYDKVVIPDNIPSSIEIVDKDHMRLFSYVPDGSLFRSARSWYNRVVEYYERENGDFKLKERTTVTYHYPFFDIGELVTTTKTERF